MRERIQKILKGDDSDPFAESALRPFWLLASAVPAGAERMTIVDLAQWARGRGRAVRT
jgi:hypothetical protein